MRRGEDGWGRAAAGPAKLDQHRFLNLSGRLGLAVLLWTAGAVAWAEPRTPKVAGAFYPADREELSTLVTGLLAGQPAPATNQKPRLLIVPHAGYQYSGSIAARGFRAVQGQAYDGVVVVAFTHRFPFEGVSVDTRETYLTPLGELPVHQEAVAALLAAPGIRHVEAAHETDEHSLEVELPFLQAALGRARIVPILMGGADFEDAQRLAEALAGLARQGDYLFIFSTDLSHYHPDRDAEAIDERTVNAILFETPQAVDRLFRAGVLEACGRGPILTSLLLAAKLGYPARELLAYAHSGETAGDRSRVVGYAAIAMHDRPAVSADRLPQEAGMALVEAARRALERTLADGRPHDGSEQGDAGPGGAAPEPVPADRLDVYPELARASGLFVTLRKRGELRGCIGRIQTPQPLRESIGQVAVDAALRDHRFSPVQAEELAELDVEVSVLTPPVAIQDPKELVAGRDGVILESEGRSGVFLPQVWEETGWTRVEFLRELASQKAGLPPDAWQHATLYTFQDQVFHESR